jgi:hypothetical protein
LVQNSFKKAVYDDFTGAVERDAAALFSSKLHSPRAKGNESFSVKVYDNWLDPQVDLPITN